MPRYILAIAFSFIILLSLVLAWRWSTTQNTVVTSNSKLAQSPTSQKQSTDIEHQAASIHSTNTPLAYNPLAPLLRELEDIRSLTQNQKKVSTERIAKAYDALDKMVAQNHLSELETIRTKQWLLTLLEPNSLLQQRFEQQLQTLKEQTLKRIEQEEKAQQEDPKFKRYKAEEARLLQEMLQKYPNDTTAAAAELQQKLDKLRAEIYQSN